MLTVVAGPIGNLGDLSPRAAEALGAADVWIVEDTRVSANLQAHLGLRRPMRILNDHTSLTKRGEYVREMVAGLRVALLTDAGTPAISDPGADLVDLCHQAGVPVDAIPGPSAVTDALALAGFFAQRFAFLGYLPRKPGPAREVLTPFLDSTMTLVLFEAPPRVSRVLGLLAEVLGSRRVAVCRELTKVHQQVWRGSLGSLPDDKAVPRRGEFTIVVEGVRRATPASDEGEDV